MINDQILDWLLDGDVAIQYHVKRDLLGSEDNTRMQDALDILVEKRRKQNCMCVLFGKHEY